MKNMKSLNKDGYTYYFKRFTPIICVLFIGVLLSVYVNSIIKERNTNRLKTEFESRAKAYTNAIENSFREYIEISEFLKNHILFSGNLDRKQFSLYATNILSRHSGLQALSWNPVVKNKFRKDYETKARIDGINEFQFTERSDKNVLVPAKIRDEYVIIYYIEPIKNNRLALGYDIASNSIRKHAIDKAFDTGEPVATAKITLVQETGNQFGTLLLNPIYRDVDSIDAIEKRRSNKRGLAVEVLRIGDTVNEALKDFRDQNFVLYLIDTTEKEKPDLLYKLPSDQTPISEIIAKDPESRKGIYFQTEFDFADRQWEIVIAPSKKFLKGQSKLENWIALLIGLILTALFVSYLLNRIIHIQEIEFRINQESTAKKQLRESEHNLNIHLQNTTIGAISYDLNFRITEWNPAAEAIFGYSKAETLGKHVAELILPCDMKELVDGIFKDVISEKGGARSKNENITKDGRRIICDWYNTALKDLNGNVFGMASLANDITESKLREDLVQAQYKLSQAFNIVDELKDGLSFCMDAVLLASDLDCGGIYLLDHNCGDLELVFHKGLSKSFVKSTSRFKKKSSNTELVMKGNPIYTTHQQLGVSLDQPESNENLLAIAIVPIKYQNQILGCMNIASKSKDTVPDRSKLALETIANQIGNAIVQFNSQKDLQESEERYRSLIEGQTDFVSRFLSDGTFIFVNDVWCQFFNTSKEEIIGSKWNSLIFKEAFRYVQEKLAPLSPTNPTVSVENRVVSGKGDIHWIHFANQGFFDDEGNLKEIQSVGRDITERKKNELILQQTKRLLNEAQEIGNIGAWEYDVISGEAFWTSNLYKIFGYLPDEIQRTHPFFIEHIVHPEDQAEVSDQFKKILSGKQKISMKFRAITKNGHEIILHGVVVPDLNESGEIFRIYGVNMDITEQKKAEKQLQQSQKMESIGRLAGGVAHDYNNALTAIMGYTELAMTDADPNGNLHADLNEVLKASRQAKDITRQLLAFARKQTIAPQVIDLNMNIKNMSKMLQHLIGEDIDLAWFPGKNLCPVKMDPSQIDQILANLCVNAKDAIAGVGKITIETDMVTLDEAYCAHHAGFIPGGFVLMAISDNGCGMDKEILDNIFEPFFTTKDIDEGTGLGLSTVYGIVKQNNGFINVYSEQGSGTTITIYLPREDSKAVEIQQESTEEIPQGRGETILVVEDDIAILKLTQKILEGLGYKVLAANSPKGAIQLAIELAKEYTNEIHLIVTDVIMPEMYGNELVKSLQPLYPDLKHIFMSGHTYNAIAHHGVLDEGVTFIQKPFSQIDLAKIVRKVLDKNE